MLLGKLEGHSSFLSILLSNQIKFNCLLPEDVWLKIFLLQKKKKRKCGMKLAKS